MPTPFLGGRGSCQAGDWQIGLLCKKRLGRSLAHPRKPELRTFEKSRESTIMIHIAFLLASMLAVTAENAPDVAPANPVLEELLEKGVSMSDGKAYKLCLLYTSDAA